MFEYGTTIILDSIVECKSCCCCSSSSRLQTMKKLCCKFHFLQQQTKSHKTHQKFHQEELNLARIPPRKETLATKNSSEKNSTLARIPPTKNTQSPPIIPGIRRTQQPTRKFFQEKTQPKFCGRKIQPNKFFGKKTHPLANSATPSFIQSLTHHVSHKFLHKLLDNPILENYITMSSSKTGNLLCIGNKVMSKIGISTIYNVLVSVLLVVIRIHNDH